MLQASHSAAVAFLPELSGAADVDRRAVKPRKAAEMLGCGITRLYELLNEGRLASYKDGASRMVLVSSIHRYQSECIRASASAGQAA